MRWRCPFFRGRGRRGQGGGGSRSRGWPCRDSPRPWEGRAALAADTEAAAGGGREVEKGFAALLHGDGGTQAALACLDSGGAAACWRNPAVGDHTTGVDARAAPGTATHFIKADSLSLLVWHIFNILGGSLAAPLLLPTGAQPAASFCPQHGIFRCFLGFT